MQWVQILLWATLNKHIFHINNEGHTGRLRRSTASSVSQLVPTQQKIGHLGHLEKKHPLTKILTAPHVHHHVVLAQLLKVVLVHYKKATSNHGSPGQHKQELYTLHRTYLLNIYWAVIWYTGNVFGSSGHLGLQTLCSFHSPMLW